MDREHAGGEVQRLGGVGALQTPGDELVAEGVLALAALEAAWQNDALDAWRRTGVLPERPLPVPVRKAA